MQQVGWMQVCRCKLLALSDPSVEQQGSSCNVRHACTADTAVSDCTAATAVCLPSTCLLAGSYKSTVGTAFAYRRGVSVCASSPLQVLQVIMLAITVAACYTNW